MPVEVIGADKVEAYFTELGGDISAEMKRAVDTSAALVSSSAKRSIQSRSAGKPYIRYNPKRRGIAARKGKSPNTDQGDLVRGILVSAGRGSISRKYEALVRSTAPHSVSLEKTHPFMKPALARNAKKILALFEKAVNSQL